MHRPWFFLINPFNTATKNNYKKFLKLSLFHLNALDGNKANPFVLTMLVPYQDVHKDFLTAYNLWIASGGLQKGSTLGITNLMADLKSRLAREWDIAVQNVYGQDTEEYMALLPNRRSSFQVGTIESRIEAVDSFVTRLEGVVPLLALKTEVSDFYTSLKDAKNKQQSKKSVTDVNSDNVEHMRMAAATLMYKDLAKFIDQYAEDLEHIAPFFDIETVRDAEQTEFTGGVALSSMVNIARRTLDPDDELDLENDGDVPLTFYVSGNAEGKALVPANTFTVLPGDTKTITAAQFGDNVLNPFINVVNDNDLAAGHYKFSIS
jgi:hypothetical protein